MKKFLLLPIIVLSAVIANAQWHEPSAVASNSQNVYTLASDGTTIYAGTGSAGISVSSNNGSTWTASNNGFTGSGVSALAISGTNVFASDKEVFLSTNNGSLWTSVSSGLPTTTINTLFINGADIFAGTNGGVYKSSNNGTLWTVANSGFTGQVVALAACGSNLFFGAPNNGVYKSVNNGGNWTKVISGLTNIDVHSLAVRGTTLFAGTSGGIFLSTNNGTNWTAVNNGLTNLNVYALLINGTNIYAGTDDGVFYSNDDGSVWTSNNDGFPANTAVQALAISGTTLFAGIRLYPYGVWIRPLSEIKTDATEINLNNAFNLYPNPASNSIIINGNDIKNNDVLLNIYNTIGTLVKTEMLKQNNQNVTIGDLPNGIYIVEMKSTDFIKSQKLIIKK
jgi:hypothetical protein